MRIALLGILSLLLLCARQSVATPAALTASPQQDETVEATSGPPQRVIVEVARFETAMGTVDLEDEEVIVIRTLKDEVKSFAKTRILRIIRLVDPEPGQSGVVMLRNGQVRQGVIVEDSFEHVLIEIEGIRARLLRETVDHVVLQPTFDQTYRKFKAALMPNNPRQHIELCRWLFQERKYELCKEELEALLDNAELIEARRMLRLVEAQLALINPAGAAEMPDPDLIADDDGEPIVGDLSERRDIITHQDVNLMRVYEIDFDFPPRVMIEPSTIQKLIEKYSDHKLIPASRAERNALFHAEPIDIVEHLMFELRARELYPEIKVVTEPHSLNQFRLNVHNTWLMNNCASNDCHGGTFGGRLYLHRTGYRDARVRYTNLLILERLKLDPELPPIIDYEHPMNSLLIQYALPREEARYPHPDVPNWQPAMPPGSAKAADTTVEWIKSMMFPRPAYPVDFEPPVLAIPPAEVPAEHEEPVDEPLPGDSPRTGRKPR